MPSTKGLTTYNYTPTYNKVGNMFHIHGWQLTTDNHEVNTSIESIGESFLTVLMVLETRFSVNLEVRTGHTACQLPKQRLHDLLKLSRLNHVKNLFQFTEKHHLSVTTSYVIYAALTSRFHHQQQLDCCIVP